MALRLYVKKVPKKPTLLFLSFVISEIVGSSGDELWLDKVKVKAELSGAAGGVWPVSSVNRTLMYCGLAAGKKKASSSCQSPCNACFFTHIPGPEIPLSSRPFSLSCLLSRLNPKHKCHSQLAHKSLLYKTKSSSSAIFVLILKSPEFLFTWIVFINIYCISNKTRKKLKFVNLKIRRLSVLHVKHIILMKQLLFKII